MPEMGSRGRVLGISARVLCLGRHNRAMPSPAPSTRPHRRVGGAAAMGQTSSCWPIATISRVSPATLEEQLAALAFCSGRAEA